MLLFFEKTNKQKKKPKTAQSHFKGGPPVKIPLRGRKIHIFWRGFPGKIRIAGAKNHVIGFASTRGHEKQPAVTDFKVAQFRGKTADLATLSGGDVLPVREWSSIRPRSAARPISFNGPYSVTNYFLKLQRYFMYSLYLYWVTKATCIMIIKESAKWCLKW